MSAGPPVPFSTLPLAQFTRSQSASDHESSTGFKVPPKLNAWGAYGSEDELGFLNRQTDDVVSSAASSEVRVGTRVNLNLPLDFLGDKPLFGRQVFQKEVYLKPPRVVHDDVWHFNTQSSTQWDGLRHFGYQSARRFYNDTTVEDIAGTSSASSSRPNVLGIQNFAHKGIVGRGVLVDFARWRSLGPGKDNPGVQAFQSFKTSPIKLSWLKSIVAWQGTEVKFGDILVIRTGFVPAYQNLSEAEVLELQNKTPPHLGGVEQSEETLQWIWDNFSAVAADQPSFEQWPTPFDWSMHEVLLAGWGCPIGELFDLEELSKTCEKLNRWTFFLVSEPVNVPGGVASPPNALAIF